MKQLYLLVTFWLVLLAGISTRSMGKCSTRPPGADRYTAIDAGLLTACNPVFTDTKNNSTANCFGNFFENTQGGQSSDEIFYKFTLATRQKVTLTHCGSNFDTFMSLLDANGNLLASADDTTKTTTTCTPNVASGIYGEAFLQRSLPAGTYYAVSEGYSFNSGLINTQISVTATPRPGATLANAIDVGTLNACGAQYADTQRDDATSCFGNEYDAALNAAQREGRPTDDIFYKFTLSSSAEVTLSHCNTGLAFGGRDPDTYIHLLDGSGNQIVSNDDYGPSCNSGRASLRRTLAAGTYYVVSELYNNSSYCNLTTTITTAAVPALGVTAPSTTLTTGGSTTLTASGATAYVWSPALGLSATTGANVTAAPTRTTTYTVSATGQTGACAPASATITIFVSALAAAPALPAADQDRNWSFSRTYDLDGNITSESKQFVDVMGRATQSQSKNIAAKQVFATQTINNLGGQPVLSTLAAPINNQEFKYRSDFVTAAGTLLPYTSANFEGKATADALDETTPGTLGYYYSQNNTWEPATAATRNPYSLTEPTPGPLGGMRRAAGPGDEFRMGAGHESRGREFTLLNELDNYSSLRPRFVTGSATTSLRAQGVKVVGVNQNGIENIFLSNREGQILARCLSGDQYLANTLTGVIDFDPANTSGSPEYQDIHVAASATSTPVTITSTSGTSASFVLINLLQNTGAETAYTGSQTLNLAPGFYRLQATNGQFSFAYAVHYGNFSYTYYDDAGRAVATVAPNGLPSGSNSAPTFVTRNVFDTASRLLSTTSPDEGTTQYVYARDGRIRFSQSARQLNEGKFSYSNYDPAGRVVESGEYQMANDRTQGVVFETSQTLPSQLYEAETAGRSNATTNTAVPGYSGSGYVENMTQPGTSSVTFSVAAPAADVYAVEVRYATGGTDTRTLSVYVAGVFSQQVSFPGTGGWNNWGTQTLALSLAGGTNSSVELRYGTADNGWVNLDYLRLLLNSTTTTNSVLAAGILEDRTRAGGLDLARCSQRNQVWYDQPFQDAQLSGRGQDFVLGGAAKTTKDGATTWYSYNDLGQLTWMVQDQPAVGTKSLDYTYDAAGNVLTVAYQKGQTDAFYHHYQYDANQRLTLVQTSLDGANKTVQATYTYYLHGPLKRVELAGNLQGLDYTYTVQGWLKSINDSQRNLDPGVDGPNASGMFKDLFGMRLEYFDNDYRSRQQAVANPTVSLNQNQPRYDGTVRASSWRTAASAQTYGMGYRYDAKGQLLESGFATVAGGRVFNFAPIKSNAEDNLSYDANGNIGTLRRLGAVTAGVINVTDNFTYQYTPGTNRLAAVNNTAGAAVLDYDYDATGQMTRQRDEQGQRYLRYDVTGKVIGVYRNYDSYRRVYSQPLATFTYDDRGFRTSKTSYGPTGLLLRTTYSVRDLQGNEMSTYVQEAAGPLQRTEVPLYGASRLGTLTSLDDKTVDPRYELNDQLGNARVVFHKPTTVKYTARMEPAQASQDEAQFQNLRTPRTYDGPDRQYVTATVNATGPSRTLNVEKGDTITFSALVRGLTDPSFIRTPPSTSRSVLIAVGAVGANSAFTPPRGIDGRVLQSQGLFQALGRIGLGISITGLLQPRKAKSIPVANFVSGSPVINLHYKFFNASGTLMAEDDVSVTSTTWSYLAIGFRAPEAGRIELSSGLVSGGEARFDDVTYEQTGGMIVQEQHTYAYGAPLTSLNYVLGNKKYRHGYQGQFTEKDEETGWDNFELRMYDSRIGRWSATDPKGQFYSPYVGMGNNPVSSIDPDGGFASGVGWFKNLLASVGIGHIELAGSCFEAYVGLTISKSFGIGVLNAGIGAASAAVRAPKWGSKAGFFVHQIANYQAVRQQGKYIDLSPRADIINSALNRATEYADNAPGSQSSENSYTHAMSDGRHGQNKLEAMKLADGFVRVEYHRGLILLQSGNLEGAYYHFGLALHTLQDATSPTHTGFKPWKGLGPGGESYLGQFLHGLPELGYPGVNSNLQQVTNHYLNLFTSGKNLPNGNLFLNLGHD